MRAEPKTVLAPAQHVIAKFASVRARGQCELGLRYKLRRIVVREIVADGAGCIFKSHEVG